MVQHIKKALSNSLNYLALVSILSWQLLFPFVAAQPVYAGNHHNNSNEVPFWCSAFDGGVKFDSDQVSVGQHTNAPITISIGQNEDNKTVLTNATGNNVTITKILVNGGNSDNEFNPPFIYPLIAPNNPGGQQSDISHIIVCYDENQIATGSIQVNKMVDEGEGFEEVGADSLFKWGLNDGSVDRDMGTTQPQLNVNDEYTVTENTVVGYKLAGWFIGEGSCDNTDNLKTLPVPVTVLADQTTVVTFCNAADDDDKITICHATASENNPYNKITIAPQAVINAHINHQHNEDIIPEFTYKGVTYSQNWDEAGQAIWNNDCQLPSQEKQGKLVVGKRLLPANDDGTFNLLINGQVEKENVGHNDTTPVVSVPVGSNSVSETGYQDTSLSNYFTTHTCKIGRIIVKVGIGDSFNVNVPKNKTVTCTLYNHRIPTITIVKEVGQDSNGQEFNFDGPKGEFALKAGMSETFKTLPFVTKHFSELTTDGWHLKDISCDTKDKHYKVNGQDLSVRATKWGDNITCTFLNEKDAVLFLEKFNNRPNPTETGDTVTYTLVVNVPEDSGVSYNTEVTDVAPENFDYNGFWTAESDLRGDIDGNPTTDPSYNSPGKWFLGDMQPGETVTLSYQTLINSVVSPGTYPDIAFVEGEKSNGERILGNLSQVDTPFVNTEVTVLADDTAGQVLGVAILPLTGLKMMWLQSILPALVVGGLYYLYDRRRSEKGARA